MFPHHTILTAYFHRTTIKENCIAYINLLASKYVCQLAYRMVHALPQK